MNLYCARLKQIEDALFMCHSVWTKNEIEYLTKIWLNEIKKCFADIEGHKRSSFLSHLNFHLKKI